ncbi:NADPH-dependent d-xylose reductase [Colletotrichum karsti]|uniref:NADPH-dependent d-xylose reductase n=1 Tax=Colletotrichum karsti TaxID=1095194 RepID=A0A9P6LKC2_9PEZI|nr:NADPH-dependent d-xylose reductase [Colletotrichum karsti]KAF9875462.1 NADPH-dependent d-xylose reductase [Colletotrichum karsti]
MARITTIPLLLLASLCGPLAAAQGLHELAVKNGKLFFGTATDTAQFADAAYTAVLNRTGEFGLLVPENSQKWDATEKTEGQFTFTNPDAVLAVARANKQMMRCHALTWHSQLPSFVSQGTWTPETLTPVIQAHISNVVSHYAGACYSWDVVNEALADDGSLRDSVFSRTLGPSFIPVSFAAAASADPAAKLYYNDFSLEFNSPKTDGAAKIVSDLKAAGVRIDGVGFQGHFEVGKTPSTQGLSKVFARFADMGVEVALTELDVRHGKLPADDAAVRQQATDYANVVKACVDTKACVGVVVWQFSDKNSWIPSTFQGQGDACLFDRDFNPKPAYESVKAVLMLAANGTGTGTGTRMPAATAGAGVGTDGGGGLMVFLKALTTAAAAAGLAQASLPGLDKIPALGLGTWLSDKGKVAHAVEFAVGEVGYDHIDAAKIYRNEDETGKGLAASGVARKDVWITSKLWNTDHRQEEAEAAIKKSIADLGVDYLDLYLIHWPVAFLPGTTKLDRDTSLVDTWKTLEGFVRANLTRHIGLSNFAKADVEMILRVAEIKPYAHEFETHPYLQQQSFVDWHREKGIEVIAYSPLANTNPTYRDDIPAIQGDEYWVRIAERKGVSVFQAVLAWGVQRGTIVIPKSTKDEHIVSNKKALEVKFSEEELKEIGKHDKKHRLSNPGRNWGVRLFADLDDPGKNEETSEEL